MAERSRNTKDINPELLRPKKMLQVEEIRGVESDEGEVEQTDEEDNVGDNEVQGKHVAKNRRKRENRKAAADEEKKNDEAFEAAVEEHWEDMTAERQEERDSNLSQEVAVEEGEEWRKPKAFTSPMRVTADERALHELTHIPYKPWCKYCVWARARNMPHGGKVEGTEGGVPRVSMDYHFMGKDDEKAHENPMLVVVNERTKEKFARLTGKKGMGEGGEMDWLVKDLAEELKTWGHAGGAGGKLIIKCDGEASIKKVREALAQFMGGEVIFEEPAKGESQSNGVVEEAGKTVREFTVLMKTQLEDKAGITVDPG